MVRKELQALETHVKELDRMSNLLFSFWDDKLSQTFNKGFVEAIQKDWRSFNETMMQSSIHLKFVFQQIEYQEKTIKSVQEGKA